MSVTDEGEPVAADSLEGVEEEEEDDDDDEEVEVLDVGEVTEDDEEEEEEEEAEEPSVASATSETSANPEANPAANPWLLRGEEPPGENKSTVALYANKRKPKEKDKWTNLKIQTRVKKMKSSCVE